MYPGRCGHYAAVQEVYQVLVAAEIRLKHITDIIVQYYSFKLHFRNPGGHFTSTFLRPFLSILTTHKALIGVKYIFSNV